LKGSAIIFSTLVFIEIEIEIQIEIDS
jgi:hypothetical protein